MNKDQDNPDTFVMDEQSEWQSTQVDDVFLPSVQVLIRWSDVEAAVESGAVVPAEAHGLWAAWAAPGSPLRRISVAADPSYPPTQVQDTVADDLPDELPPAHQGGGIRQVVMLLVGAVAGAALMFVLGN
ncbi:hypothetical protein [Hydrogenophaga pseudoflava]|uniref:hypothetical protein n=1 Tax=Hydrogenophaga pseudoflava TaxID=47421 RepID=UPI0008242304|nr:hypothetical protein [Hydrogenophaga pseudoflava]